jgi:uncharacterized protein (DUF697 family)
MNQPLFLHVVERLESLVGKLPAAIQKPILSELTPLKELFLQQRPPRLLFSGSKKTPLSEIVCTLFAGIASEQLRDISMENYRWHDLNLGDRGTISMLDARGADESAATKIEDELKRQPADIIFFMDDSDGARKPRKNYFDNLITCLAWNDKARPDMKVIGIVISSAKRSAGRDHNDDEREPKMPAAFASNAMVGDRLLRVFTFFARGGDSGREARALMSTLACELPNEARIEMVRISRDRKAQAEIAQILVKSTSAICAAIGAQPIPLADLPILTTLQLVMVSGIMYVSGRERSLRAATEFVGALGANVGAGMLLREGTRAILKFFPGWGNVVCGMVAGAGTYAIGRAAIVFFLEGVSLKDARRTYLTSRKRSARPALLGGRRHTKERAEGK